ncbi:MAG: peptidylprolyl isomerase [Verrucomicrobiae bacterium]|nr:peptidylprolyl isomerase [Verrucomicrobiae bacterium]
MASKIISFHYQLTVGDGKTLDSSEGREPMTFMSGVRQIIPGLEVQLVAMKPGERKRIELKAADAYGARDLRKIVKVPRAQLAADGKVAVGDRFRASENPHAPPFVVTNVTETHATLDANHPLAGVDLNFNVEITAIRDATHEELAHGHAHEQSGHAHGHGDHQGCGSGGCGCHGH